MGGTHQGHTYRIPVRSAVGLMLATLGPMWMSPCGSGASFTEAPAARSRRPQIRGRVRGKERRPGVLLAASHNGDLPRLPLPQRRRQRMAVLDLVIVSNGTSALTYATVLLDLLEMATLCLSGERGGIILRIAASSSEARRTDG